MVARNRAVRLRPSGCATRGNAQPSRRGWTRGQRMAMNPGSRSPGDGGGHGEEHSPACAHRLAKPAPPASTRSRNCASQRHRSASRPGSASLGMSGAAAPAENCSGRRR